MSIRHMRSNNYGRAQFYYSSSYRFQLHILYAFCMPSTCCLQLVYFVRFGFRMKYEKDKIMTLWKISLAWYFWPPLIYDVKRSYYLSPNELTTEVFQCFSSHLQTRTSKGDIFMLFFLKFLKSFFFWQSKRPQKNFRKKGETVLMPEEIKSWKMFFIEGATSC